MKHPSSKLAQIQSHTNRPEEVRTQNTSPSWPQPSAAAAAWTARLLPSFWRKPSPLLPGNFHLLPCWSSRRACSSFHFQSPVPPITPLELAGQQGLVAVPAGCVGIHLSYELRWKVHLETSTPSQPGTALLWPLRGARYCSGRVWSFKNLRKTLHASLLPKPQPPKKKKQRLGVPSCFNRQTLQRYVMPLFLFQLWNSVQSQGKIKENI